MPLPFILAGAVAVGAYLIYDEVSSSQNKEIESGKNEVKKKIKDEIDLKLKELEKYETKIKLQFYVAIVCLLVFCIFWLVLYPLTWLVAIFVSSASMYLLAEIIVLFMYKGIVKQFRKVFWNNWKKNKLEFTRKAIENAAHRALMDAIYRHIAGNDIKGKVRAIVDRKIESLSFVDTLAYDIFGSSRKNITNDICRKALNEIDYESIIERIKRIIMRIIMITVTYSIVAFLVRFGVIELSGLGWLKWIALPFFFGVFFWWHKQKILSSDAEN